MVRRYEVKEIADLCQERAKLDRWIRVELAVLRAWNRRGVVSDPELRELEARIGCDPKAVARLESQTKHDVFAFLLALDESIASPAKKWIHHGLTSTDVVDTANGLYYLEANRIVAEAVDGLVSTVKRMALEHAGTVMLARTHGQAAEPTTFGMKLIGWYDRLMTCRQNFMRARRLVESGKISGATGTHAHFDGLGFEREVCAELGLGVPPVSTQVLPRERHALYFHSLVALATAVWGCANEIRLLAIQEIGEVREGFAKNQRGSSAMPQKKNPIGCENVCGLARVARALGNAAYENVALWNERDISHSSAERILNEDLLGLVVSIFRRFGETLSGLWVDEGRMRANLEAATPGIYAQTIMLHLVGRRGVQRMRAYDAVRAAIGKGRDAASLAKEIGERLGCAVAPDEIARLTRPEYHVRFAKKIIGNAIKEWERDAKRRT